MTETRMCVPLDAGSWRTPVPRHQAQHYQQPATLTDVLAQQRLQSRLEEGRLALRQQGNLRLVDVDPDRLEPELSHPGSVDSSEITGADDRDTHVCTP